MSKFVILPDGQMVDRSLVVTVQKVTMEDGEINIVMQLEGHESIFIVCDSYADQEDKMTKIREELTEYKTVKDDSLN